MEELDDKKEKKNPISSFFEQLWGLIVVVTYPLWGVAMILYFIVILLVPKHLQKRLGSAFA
jgi:hypothetical protein